MEVLLPKMPVTLLYDQTHDNPTVHQKLGLRQMLPLIGLNSAAFVFAGSIKGYDEIYPDRASVVSERRLYKNFMDVKLVEEIKSITVGFVYSENPNAKSVTVFGTWDGWKQGI